MAKGTRGGRRVYIRKDGTWKGMGEMGGGFTSAGGGGEAFEMKALHPAEFNTQGRFVSQEAAVKMFRDKYGDAAVEYGISIDNQGFVHRHVQGGRTSVAIGAAGRDHLIVHNHPSGGAFSKADLLVFAQDARASGIVATSSKSQYTVTKTKSFNSQKWNKAVTKAKWPTDLSYDEGADWWLKKNAPKLGVNYKRG